jgi:hypothetical protein
MTASICVRYLAKPSVAFFILGACGLQGGGLIASLLYNENPGHDDRGFCPYSISRCREMHHLRWETSMRAQYADALISCNKYRQINYQLPNEVISRSMTLPRALALCAVSPKTKLEPVADSSVRNANPGSEGNRRWTSRAAC